MSATRRLRAFRWLQAVPPLRVPPAAPRASGSARACKLVLPAQNRLLLRPTEQQGGGCVEGGGKERELHWPGTSTGRRWPGERGRQAGLRKASRQLAPGSLRHWQVCLQEGSSPVAPHPASSPTAPALSVGGRPALPPPAPTSRRTVRCGACPGGTARLRRSGSTALYRC